MTPDKQKQKLAGQTAIAQKVFQAVPIAEAWTVAQISQSLHRTTGARLDRHTLQGCLRALADPDDAKRILISAFKIETQELLADEWAKFGDLRMGRGLHKEIVVLGTQSRGFSKKLGAAFIEWLYAFGTAHGVQFKAQEEK